MNTSKVEQWLKHLKKVDLHPVIAYDPACMQLLHLNFTDSNKDLTAAIIDDTNAFSEYVTATLKSANAQFGIGGYNENRTVYSRSRVFDAPFGQEARSLHLGVDIWGEVGTEIFCPIDGIVHSYAFNDQFGDYGATIILQHEINGFSFHTLYGHLSLADLSDLKDGQIIKGGDLLAHFGPPEENGHWPPHLHFQIVFDLEGKRGDYPGVCALSDKTHYLNNCPDPDAVLGLYKYL
ncbi:MAG: peptidoglycan DD-metalloendopeptidase family protein [Sphingobacteriia bacterium]